MPAIYCHTPNHYTPNRFHLQNTFNGLCLDAPDGMGLGAALTLAHCNKLKNGKWNIGSANGTVWIQNRVGTSDNDGTGWCVDYFLPRTGETPTLWSCNPTDAQRYVREPGTPRDKLSFSVPQIGFGGQTDPHELIVLPTDVAGSSLHFLPIVSHKGDRHPKYEWVYYKK
ncbi:hypothetical protein BGX21_007692 [Mortierella sp. AD011]|nr:hypothetical protein BGX20_007203 [Mortierella sp. AD010]KAF9398514.1 hypothetical protein BGX21_007692 [Mortierella sp. AD011]